MSPVCSGGQQGCDKHVFCRDLMFVFRLVLESGQKLRFKRVCFLAVSLRDFKL